MAFKLFFNQIQARNDFLLAGKSFRVKERADLFKAKIKSVQPRWRRKTSEASSCQQSFNGRPLAFAFSLGGICFVWRHNPHLRNNIWLSLAPRHFAECHLAEFLLADSPLANSVIADSPLANSTTHWPTVHRLTVHWPTVSWLQAHWLTVSQLIVLKPTVQPIGQKSIGQQSVLPTVHWVTPPLKNLT